MADLFKTSVAAAFATAAGLFNTCATTASFFNTFSVGLATFGKPADGLSRCFIRLEMNSSITFKANVHGYKSLVPEQLRVKQITGINR